MLVDTHAHLSFPQFADDLDKAIENARLCGVCQIVNVGTNLEVSRAAVALASPADGLYATAGFHPHDVSDATEDALSSLADLMGSEGLVAVGETGLDYYRDYAPHDVQEEIFRWHIRRAAELGLPLVVHSRGAEDRVLEILDQESGGRAAGVLHCFGGDLDQAAKGVELGLHIGLGGTVTFKKSASLGVALGVPPDRLLLETDCPYLAPVPHRGKRNEPAFVRDVAALLAREMETDLAGLAEQTTHNACRLFGLEPN